MTDLPKLELDEHYYLKLKNGKIEIQKFIGGFVLRNDDEIAEVLEQVPSYDEWKKAYECVVSENEEITMLKELLKECRENIEVTGYNEFGKAILLNKIAQVLGEE